MSLARAEEVAAAIVPLRLHALWFVENVHEDDFTGSPFVNVSKHVDPEVARLEAP